jgi:hypothetical protein|tara:strand:- start:99 stop:941 length:843 start_codon:yes stop_codon:yes gene_type:complete
MASSYSNLKIQLMNTGENSGSWGDITNTNLGTAIEEAICESADVAFSQDSVTLTLSDVNTTQVARHLRLNLTGTGSAGITLTVPDIEKNYIINNTLATDVGIKNSSGSQVTVPNGRSAIVYSTGSGVVDAITSLNTAEITQLTVARSTHFEGGVSAASVLNVAQAITGSSTVSDANGDLRNLQISQSSNATYTLTTNDTGQMVRLNSAGIGALIPSATFAVGDIISIMNTTSTTGSITSQITMHVGGGASATGTATLGINNIANIYFVSPDGCIITGGAT